MGLLSILAAEVAETEPSKTLFYVLGGALAVWAVVLTAAGMTKADFPGSVAVQRGVIGISALLVAGAMAAAVITG